jgi:hypothetical protein
MPKLQAGSFFPSLLKRRRQVDQSLSAVITEAYLHGSTRKVDNVAKPLGADTGIPKSEVSRICTDLDAKVAPFGGRLSTLRLLVAEQTNENPDEKMSKSCRHRLLTSDSLRGTSVAETKRRNHPRRHATGSANWIPALECGGKHGGGRCLARSYSLL